MATQASRAARGGAGRRRVSVRRDRPITMVLTRVEYSALAAVADAGSRPPSVAAREALFQFGGLDGARRGFERERERIAATAAAAVSAGVPAGDGDGAA